MDTSFTDSTYRILIIFRAVSKQKLKQALISVPAKTNPPSMSGKLK